MSGIQPDTVFLYTIRFDTYKAKAEAYNRICYIIKNEDPAHFETGPSLSCSMTLLIHRKFSFNYF